MTVTRTILIQTDEGGSFGVKVDKVGQIHFSTNAELPYLLPKEAFALAEVLQIQADYANEILRPDEAPDRVKGGLT